MLLEVLRISVIKPEIPRRMVTALDGTDRMKEKMREGEGEVWVPGCCQTGKSSKSGRKEVTEREEEEGIEWERACWLLSLALDL